MSLIKDTGGNNKPQFMKLFLFKGSCSALYVSFQQNNLQRATIYRFMSLKIICFFFVIIFCQRQYLALLNRKRSIGRFFDSTERFALIIFIVRQIKTNRINVYFYVI